MINITHITSGDILGGAENVLIHLICKLKSNQDYNISVILLNYGKLHDSLVSQQVNVTVLEEGKLNSIQINKKIYNFLKNNHTDIIHTHGFKANIIGNISRLFIAKKKIISFRTEHGYSEYFKGIKKLKSIFYTAINLLVASILTDKIICVSNHIAKSKFPSFLHKKITVIHNGIDLEMTRPVRDRKEIAMEFNVPTNQYRIGAIGRLVPVKDFENFIEAVNLVVAKKKECKFFIIGEGPLKEQLLKKITDNNLDNDIVMTGFRDDIIDIINFLDIIVISSKMEGIPLTLLEALYLGKTVIATSVGGITEVISNEQLGHLVPPQNSQELAAAIIQVLDTYKSISETDNSSREYIATGFSSQEMVENTTQEYQQSLLKDNN